MIKRERGGMSFLERKRRGLNQNPPSINLINLERTKEYACQGRSIREGLVEKREKGGVKEERRESKITNKT
jgi:hypothetical protein